MNLSIVIPCYNVQEYIYQCLSSVLLENLDDSLTYEVIIINDGSTDCTLDKIKNFVANHCSDNNNIRVINQSNKGLSYSRNLGVKYAQGDYVYFLDSDDWIDLEALFKITDTCIKQKCELGVGNYYDFVDEKVKLNSKQIQKECLLSGTKVLKDVYINTLTSVVWRWVFKREYLLNNAFYFQDGVVYEDIEFMPKVIVCAKSIFLSTQHFYYYRLRSGSITNSSLDFKKINDSILIALGLLEFLNNNKLNINEVLIFHRIVFAFIFKKVCMYQQSIDYDTRKKIYKIMRISSGIYLHKHMLALGLYLMPNVIKKITSLFIKKYNIYSVL